MASNKKETKKSTDVITRPSADSLFSFDEFENFFDDFLSRRWPRLSDWNLPFDPERGIPKVDILDSENEIEVQAALPGVDKNDLEVTLTPHSITIRASTKKETKEEGKYYRREISRGEFQRTLPLPDNVDDEKASASFKDGLLKVVLPKTKKSKRKAIDIQ